MEAAMLPIRIAVLLIVFTPFAADASQGPGAGPGTASMFTQHILAGSIAVIGVGLLAVALVRCATPR
jgi:hypothetical protein